jgi:hypothetical protein
MLKSYDMVGELIVQTSTKKPLSYWLNAPSAEVIAEHERVFPKFRRAMVSSFLKQMPKGFVKALNSEFRRSNLFDNLLTLVTADSVADYPKTQWPILLASSPLDTENITVGYDYVRNTNTSVNSGSVGISLNRSFANNFFLHSTNGIFQGMQVRLTLYFVRLPTLDHIEVIENTMMSEVSNTNELYIETDLDGYSVGVEGTLTYLICKIEPLVLIKGRLRPYMGGIFSTIQLVTSI